MGIFLFLFTQGRLITGAEDAMKIDKKRGLAHEGEATTGTHARNLRRLQSAEDPACNCYCIIASGESKMVKGKSIAISQNQTDDEESENGSRDCICTCKKEECDHSEDEDSDRSEDEDSDHSEDKDSGHSEDEDGDE